MSFDMFSCKHIFRSCIGVGFMVEINPNNTQFNSLPYKGYFVKCFQYLSTLESDNFEKCIHTLKIDNTYEECVDCRYNFCPLKSEAEDFMCHYSLNSELVIKKADTCKKLYCKYAGIYHGQLLYFIFNNPVINCDINLLNDFYDILNNSELGQLCLKCSKLL